MRSWGEPEALECGVLAPLSTLEPKAAAGRGTPWRFALRTWDVRVNITVVNESIPVMCPYCGEMSDLDFEDIPWGRQSYVQDCPVCCQPWQVELTRDAEGDWQATVKTQDE